MTSINVSSPVFRSRVTMTTPTTLARSAIERLRLTYACDIQRVAIDTPHAASGAQAIAMDVFGSPMEL